MLLPVRIALTGPGLIAFALPVTAGALVYTVALYFLSSSDFSYFLRLMKQVMGARPLARTSSAG